MEVERNELQRKLQASSTSSFHRGNNNVAAMASQAELQKQMQQAHQRLMFAEQELDDYKRRNTDRDVRLAQVSGLWVVLLVGGETTAQRWHRLVCSL